MDARHVLDRRERGALERNCALVFALVLIANEGVGSAQPTTAPSVAWSKNLAGPTPTDLQKALNGPWVDSYDTRNAKTAEERKVSSCAEAKALPAGFEPETDQDLRAFESDRLHCNVMERLLTAKPATISHLAGFTLDDAVLGQLPASLIPTPSPSEGRRFEAAVTRGVTWKKLEPKLRVVKTKSDSITVESPKTRAILTVLGRGDMNGDGIEDLVLERAGGGRKGTWTSTEAFIITRRSGGAPFEVVARVR